MLIPCPCAPISPRFSPHTLSDEGVAINPRTVRRKSLSWISVFSDGERSDRRSTDGSLVDEMPSRFSDSHAAQHFCC